MTPLSIASVDPQPVLARPWGTPSALVHAADRTRPTGTRCQRAVARYAAPPGTAVTCLQCQQLGLAE